MWYVVVFVLGVAAGAIGSYLVLRNNPAIKAKVDQQADKLDPGR